MRAWATLPEAAGLALVLVLLLVVVAAVAAVFRAKRSRSFGLPRCCCANRIVHLALLSVTEGDGTRLIGCSIHLLGEGRCNCTALTRDEDGRSPGGRGVKPGDNAQLNARAAQHWCGILGHDCEHRCGRPNSFWGNRSSKVINPAVHSRPTTLGAEDFARRQRSRPRK